MSPGAATGYENEPDEVFSALPAHLQAQWYHREMAGFYEDAAYFQRHLDTYRCRTVLELGCGTGRVSEYLRQRGCRAIGIDLSRAMLTFSRRTRRVPVACMDMRRLGLAPCFDAALIPYNTLNLLQSRADIDRCLREVRQILAGPRLLLLHLFTPDDGLIRAAGTRLFQFTMLDLPEGGKLIKETIRTYIPEADALHLEERYKLRPFTTRAANRNYVQKLKLAALSGRDWLEIIEQAGFRVISHHGSFDRRVYAAGKDTTLLVLTQAV